MKLATGIAVLTLALASAYSAPSSAQVLHGNSSLPSARCQSALPVFETNIRKRPLAVQNEGADLAYVTCSFEFDSANAIGGSADMLDAYFTNHGTTPVDVACTAVTGWQTGENEYVSMNVTVDPAVSGEESQGGLFWVAEDFEGGGLETGLVSISCALPPSVGVNDTYIYWESDDAPI